MKFFHLILCVLYTQSKSKKKNRTINPKVAQCTPSKETRYSSISLDVSLITDPSILSGPSADPIGKFQNKSDDITSVRVLRSQPWWILSLINQDIRQIGYNYLYLLQSKDWSSKRPISILMRSKNKLSDKFFETKAKGGVTALELFFDNKNCKLNLGDKLYLYFSDYNGESKGKEVSTNRIVVKTSMDIDSKNIGRFDQHNSKLAISRLIKSHKINDDVSKAQFTMEDALFYYVENLIMNSRSNYLYQYLSEYRSILNTYKNHKLNSNNLINIFTTKNRYIPYLHKEMMTVYFEIDKKHDSNYFRP